MRKKIELKGICNEVEITLNNLINCRVEEGDEGVSVVFDSGGMSVIEGEDENKGSKDAEYSKDCDAEDRAAG